MPPTNDQIEDFRADVGDSDPDNPVFSDEEITRLYERAGAIYEETTLIETLVRVYGIKQLLASSAKMTTYKQNQSSDNLSDVFKHLKELLGLYQDELAEALAIEAGGGAAFMSLKKTPTRKKDVPGCWD